MSRWTGGWRSFLFLGAGLLLAGCPASQTWTTPRTIPAGRIQHTAGVEFAGLIAADECEGDATDGCVNVAGFIPIPFPAYVLRIGAADMLDIGIKASSTGTFGADFKIQLVRSDFFDLAIDPGVTFPWIFSFGYLNLPIMFGLNFGESMTLVLYPKGTYALLFADYDADEEVATVDGLFIGGGAALQLRISDGFAITPGFEWQTLVTDTEDGSVSLIVFGIGFSFGAMQDHSSGVPSDPGMVPPQG